MTLARIYFPSSPTRSLEELELGVFHGEFCRADRAVSSEELLPSADPVASGVSGRNRWVRAESFTFVEQSRVVPDDDAMVRVTRDIYQDILAFRASNNHTHMVRFWNCVPHINRGVADLEVYKRFCCGRLEGFRAASVGAEAFPAASALGHQGERLTVHMLLSDKPGNHRANPLQINAFQYPRQYGKSSPSFARATEVPMFDGRKLVFISGTASIRGHESLHHGDVNAQTIVSIENIDILLRQSEKTLSNVQTMRIYVRHSEDLETIRAVTDRLVPAGEKIYLLADICRAELLVEIECVAL